MECKENIIGSASLAGGLGYCLSRTPATAEIDAALLGTGLGLSSLPKTMFKLSTSVGVIEMMYWYQISSVGVTDKPSPGK